MCHYTHFTTEERELSRVLKAQGFNQTQIAERLGRSKSSVSREFARNSREDGTYSANIADKNMPNAEKTAAENRFYRRVRRGNTFLKK